MPVYYSSLILEVHTNDSGESDIDVITFEKSGLVENKLNFDFLENLGKVVYQGCLFTEIHAVIHGRKARRMNTTMSNITIAIILWQELKLEEKLNSQNFLESLSE